MVNKEEQEQALKAFGKGKKKEAKKGGRAVIYQRVSSKEQENNFSQETQVETCHKWAKSHGYDVVKDFVGEHESAKSDTNRKRFNEMLAFVEDKRNKIDAVIVYSTSRFSRTGTKSFSIVDRLKEKGITVFSASSNYDARTPEGEWMQGVELCNSRHDNAIKSRDVINSGRTALRKGHWITRAPLGYDMVTIPSQQTQSITVNEKGVLIRKAFKMKVNENMSNEEVRVKMKTYGLDLNKQTWSRIFSNIFYAGYFSHPFLEGDVIRGPHEPLVSLLDFYKINNIVLKTHTRGYETKADKEYAPLLGSIKCPVCGGNLTASLSTKMRKKYGRDVGYYVCSHKNCKCNIATKKANSFFEAWLDGVSLPEGMSEALELQLRKAFPVLNKQSMTEVVDIKTRLAHKATEIEQVEYNLAMAPSPKVMEICTKQLEKLEAEKKAIEVELNEKNKEILNLNEYISYGLSLKDNMLKLWQLSSLSQKRHIQKLVFPDGIVYSKENDDIEPLSKNDFLFVYPSEIGSCEQKESGQTSNFTDLSALAPLLGLEPRTP